MIDKQTPMNPHQIAAAQRFTTDVERLNRLTNGDPMNGTIVWHRLNWGPGMVVLKGSNVEGLRWYETHIHVVIEIGPRGGIWIINHDGFLKKHLKGH